MAIIKRITKEFKIPFKFQNMEFICTVSIGIATYPKDARELIKKADAVMYREKKIKNKKRKTITKYLMNTLFETSDIVVRKLPGLNATHLYI